MEKHDSKLIDLRKLIRAKSSEVMSHLASNYIYRDSNGNAIKNVEPPICIFCAAMENITREHIIPRWVFNKNDKAFFDIGVNGQSQSYNKSTVPVCARCNADLLNTLEKHIQSVFKAFHDTKTLLDFETTEMSLGGWRLLIISFRL